jgi:hypothetical protein
LTRCESNLAIDGDSAVFADDHGIEIDLGEFGDFVGECGKHL